MPSEEHIKSLKQGIKIWNKWRDANPDILPYLTNFDIKNQELLSPVWGFFICVGPFFKTKYISKETPQFSSSVVQCH